MIRITWDAYEKFRCLAEKCPDSCCQGWEVDVDEDAAAYYRSMEGELGDRLRQVLKTQDDQSSMILENGRCPMWRQDGLCRIQAEKGHDALCKVCREYPRLYMDYGDFAEWGLEMSCPEAARLLFADMSSAAEVVSGGEEPEYDPEIMDILQKSRRQLLVFWQNSDFSVPDALKVTLIFAHQTQSTIDGGELIGLNPQRCRHIGESSGTAGELEPLLEFFKKIEILTPTWHQRLCDPQGGIWDPRLKNFAIYLIRRYWYQAVWDYDLICRAKLIVSACILVNALGGDPVETAQLFSKEIENDPDNRDAILDAAYSCLALTDVNLLGLLNEGKPKERWLL